MLDPTSEFRARFSALTSLVLAIVFIGLPYVPPYFDFLRWLAVVVLLADAVVKFLNILSIREFVSALYSITLFVSSLTFFKILGSPLSEITAILWLVDAALKLIPGDQRILGVDEYVFRHYYSAIMTTLLGISIMFGVAPFNSMLFGFLAGLLILLDGIVKLEYAHIL